MAFTRKFLTALGIEAEKIDEIMSAHVEVTDALKAQISGNADAADELSKVKDELAKLKASHKEQSDKLTAAEKERDDYKGKYDTVSTDLEHLKTENAERESTEKRKNALSDFLKEQKYSDNAVRIIRNKSDFYKSVNFDDSGKATNLDEVLKSIQADEDFAGFTPKTSEKSHTPPTPPANNGGAKKVTWEDVDKITDAKERQKVMALNRESLGI